MFFLLGATPLMANDGAYLMYGGAIYPTKETTISMDKENLSFTVADQMCTVDIYFEFNNPENTPKKLMVGFQAPGAFGDVELDRMTMNEIRDFRIMHNNAVLPYELKIAKCADCPLQEVDQVTSNHQADDYVFVFLFEVTFQPGLNTINHSYSFPASTSVMYDEFYNYILTTGSKWAGGKIKDLTVSFDLGKDSYFYVSDVFGDQAKWSITGTGKVTETYFEDSESNNRMVRLLSGTLTIDVDDLAPEKDISFGIIDRSSFITDRLYGHLIEAGMVHQSDEYTIASADKRTLYILENTIYAQHGLYFEDKDLREYFAGFDWYISDPNLKASEIQLSAEEQQLLQLILDRRKMLEP